MSGELRSFQARADVKLEKGAFVGVLRVLAGSNRTNGHGKDFLISMFFEIPNLIFFL